MVIQLTEEKTYIFVYLQQVSQFLLVLRSTSVTYQARYTTTHDLLHGGQGWQEGDNFTVFMKDAIYKVTIDAISTSVVQANLALVRPQPTPFDKKQLLLLRVFLVILEKV